MDNSLEIGKKANGFSVDVMSICDDDYNVEELVFQDPLDVLVEVLRWLGYDEQTRDSVIEMLDDDAAYELTDKGHETLARLEHERAELERLEHERAYQAWEAQRAAAMKRGSGRNGGRGNTTRQYETTTTGR